jgi:flagellar basal-body rod modification protein FlgD
MATSAINNVAAAAVSGPSSTAAQGSSALGKDDFLKLLMAQLSNQDPTQPADPTTFTTQLAQFSQLELQQNANTTLSDLAASQSAGNQVASVNMVGKNVTFSTSTVTIAAGGGTLLTGSLAGDAANVSAVITNGAGKIIRTIKAGAISQGNIQIPWDGRDDSGAPMAAGSYSVQLNATDVQGKAVTATAQQSALITGITFLNGVTQLIANGVSLPLGSVTEIDQPTPTQTTTH